jgi:hypothetical protein
VPFQVPLNVKMVGLSKKFARVLAFKKVGTQHLLLLNAFSLLLF